MIHNKLTSLFADSQSITIPGLRASSPAWLAATVAKHHTCCCIVPDEHLISIFEQDLHLFTDKQVLKYPGHEIPPYTPLSPDQLTTAARLSTLYRLKEGETGIMVTSIEALLRRIMPASLLTSVAEYLMAGEDCDQDDLLNKLSYLGYDKVALVQSVGDFSVRGGIIDIYPPPFAIEGGPLHEGPIRLDFFGDTIESLRSFDPFTQRSTGEISEATLLPVTDLLFDYNSPTIKRSLAKLFEQHGEQYNWDSEETARLMERMTSGRRFAGM
jgi:transcription-repair coupling factor (superfamily II helicase)